MARLDAQKSPGAVDIEAVGYKDYIPHTVPILSNLDRINRGARQAQLDNRALPAENGVGRCC